MPAAPTLRLEKGLIRSGLPLVCGVDEVGRGALGGPVSVGVVVVDASVRRPLAGVRDSKLLTPAARQELVPRIRRWSVAHAVGHASAHEVDERGLIAALRMAGLRALASLAVAPDVVVLDGSHDWLTPPDQAGLFDEPLPAMPPRVVTRVKADLTCASVAAASVLAKVERDGLMVALSTEHPGYGWEINKGYASPEHVRALREIGPCVQHRRSWSLPVNNAASVEECPPE